MNDPRTPYAVEADRAYQRGEWLFAEVKRQRGAELAMRAPEEWEMGRVLKSGEEVHALGFIPYVAVARLRDMPNSRAAAMELLERVYLTLEAGLREAGASPLFRHTYQDSIGRAGYDLIVSGVMP